MDPVTYVDITAGSTDALTIKTYSIPKHFFNFSTDTGKRTVYISVKIISEIIVDKQMNSYYNLNKIDPTP